MSVFLVSTAFESLRVGYYFLSMCHICTLHNKYSILHQKFIIKSLRVSIIIIIIITTDVVISVIFDGSTTEDERL